MPVFRTVQDAQSGEIRLEALHQPLYDAQTIDTGVSEASYFNNAGGRPALDSNVKTASQLSWPKRFSIKALRLVPAFGTAAADLLLLYQNTLFKLDVGEKNYLQIPAFLLTPGVGIETQNLWNATAGTGTPTVTANNGRPDHFNIFSLIHAIYIPPVQNFSASLTITGAPTFSAPFKTWLFLEGELLREIQ